MTFNPYRPESHGSPRGDDMATTFAEAPCIADPEIFFPPDELLRGHHWDPSPARRVCAECPVKQECRSLAKIVDHTPGIGYHGVWGGKGKHERKTEDTGIARTVRPRRYPTEPSNCPGCGRHLAAATLKSHRSNGCPPARTRGVTK